MAVHDILNKILEALNSLSEDSQRAAKAKCQELQFDPNRGILSFDESIINLNFSSAILRDAIANGKLNQLPLTVQNSLLVQLGQVQRFLLELSGGADQVVNLVNAIEQLNTLIWQYGLHNLSDEIAGYQTKMNQLKFLEVELGELRTKIEAALKLKESLEELVTVAKTKAEESTGSAKGSTAALDETKAALSEVKKLQDQVSQLATTTEQDRGRITSFLSDSETRSSKIQALESSIHEFHEGITAKNRELEKLFTDSRTSMTALEQSAKTAVQTNKDETVALIEKLKQLEGQIEIAIKKATGYSLFNSFQTRRDALRSSRIFWLFATLLLSFVAVFIAYQIAVTNLPSTWDIALALKLLIGIPLAFVIWFCATQYGRERRLEEEYAFKSNISISLVPYKDLVSELVPGDDKSKFFDFIVSSVNNVFSSPTDRVFHNEQDTTLSRRGLKTIEAWAKLIENLKGIAKPIE